MGRWRGWRGKRVPRWSKIRSRRTRHNDRSPRSVWKSFLANCDVFQAFGANDVDAAEYLSRTAGETTILVQSENCSQGLSRGKHDQVQEGAGETTSEKSRRLITADEILRMGQKNELQLLCLKGQDPLLARRLNYLRDMRYQDRFDPSPEHREVAE